MQRILKLRTAIGLLALSLSCTLAHGQTRISGLVSYNKISPVANVNISIEGSYDGTMSDDKGRFSFTTEETGSVLIRAQVDGYESITIPLEIKGQEELKIELPFTTKTTRLMELVVRPKLFEISDDNRSTVFNTLDILTTAHDANITTAVKSLPSAQQIGESSDLFVRGGTGTETKTYVDGLLVTNFNYNSPANVSSRSRFPAGMFNGTYFSSGGYSAQYGQALSSTLVLESEDMPVKSSADLTFSPIYNGGGVQKVFNQKRTMIGATVTYTNLAPYFALSKPDMYDFVKKPEYLDVTGSFRQKLKNNGILKFYGSIGTNQQSLRQANQEFPAFKDSIGLGNRNIYTNLTYKQPIGNGWKLYLGSSYSLNRDQTRVRTWNKEWQNEAFANQTTLVQGRAVLSRRIGGQSKLYLGSEYQHLDQSFAASRFTENYTSTFAEVESNINDRWSARVGLRGEYSALLGKFNLAPRAALGYNVGESGLFSFSYGQFYQRPEDQYLFIKPQLNFTRADHYIFGYQKLSNDRTIRMEAFYKQYNQLIKANEATLPNNNGYGFARGVEVFWRDKKTIESLDYWLSYSFLDTKRDFDNYPFLVQPSFAARHTLSAVVKRYFSKINTNIGLTYSFATGRPYYNPNLPESAFMSERTMNYNNLALNFAYLPQIRNMFSVVVLTFSNILGNRQIYGYTYAKSGSNWLPQPVQPLNNPFVFLGYFINFGVDRRSEIINSRM